MAILLNILCTNATFKKSSNGVSEMNAIKKNAQLPEIITIFVRYL